MARRTQYKRRGSTIKRGNTDSVVNRKRRRAYFGTVF